MVRRAMELGQQGGQEERASIFAAGAAVWESLFGNLPLARKRATEALALSKSRDAEYAAAFALAVAGDSSRSQALANDLQNRFPDDTCVRFTYVPTLRALLALKRGDPAQAIELLQTAATYELAVPAVDYYFYFGGLYSAYVRGEAYLALKQGVDAVGEFQKVITHQGIVAGDPVGALARLGLARAYELQGDTAKSRAAYQDFLALWKDADPDIPILKQAKAEYAKSVLSSASSVRVKVRQAPK
jgi:tetratricopeptide (TPR) repeat protein